MEEVERYEPELGYSDEPGYYGSDPFPSMRKVSYGDYVKFEVLEEVTKERDGLKLKVAELEEKIRKMEAG